MEDVFENKTVSFREHSGSIPGTFREHSKIEQGPALEKKPAKEPFWRDDNGFFFYRDA